MKYTLSIDYREAGLWMDTGDAVKFFDDRDSAENAAESAASGDYGPGEYRATVTDENGCEVYSTEWTVDPEQDLFDSADWLASRTGEWTTEHYGIGPDGQCLHTVQNGGSKGAHSRQEGDGRWNTMASPVEEIGMVELLRGIMELNYCDFMEAAKLVADKHPTQSLKDILVFRGSIEKEEQ